MVNVLLDPTRDRPAPRRRLTRTAIAAAVVEVGFDKATTTAVAEHLGVNHATLYGHVEGRDDMVLAGAEQVFAATSWPSVDGGWPDLLTAEARHLWRLFVDHPGLAAVVGRAPTPPPSMTSRYGTVAGRLVAHGFAPLDALDALSLVCHHVADAAERRTSVVDVPAEQWAAWQDHWSASLGPELADAMAVHIRASADDQFEQSLAILLTGIATHLAPTDPPAAAEGTGSPQPR